MRALASNRDTVAACGATNPVPGKTSSVGLTSLPSSWFPNPDNDAAGYAGVCICAAPTGVSAELDSAHLSPLPVEFTQTETIPDSGAAGYAGACICAAPTGASAELDSARPSPLPVALTQTETNPDRDATEYAGACTCTALTCLLYTSDAADE